MANAVRAARAGLQDPNRPLGSFLFLGPPAWARPRRRALAEFLFDDEQALVRIDMSEYQEKHTVSRLIGRPRLRRLRRGRPADRSRPPAALRGHPVRRGREGPPRGPQHPPPAAGRRTPDRRPGPHRRLPQHDRDHDQQPRQPARSSPPAGWLGAGAQGASGRVMEAVRAHFRPELLNRIDDIVIFSPLGRDRSRRSSTSSCAACASGWPSGRWTSS